MKTDTREQIKNGLIILAFFLASLAASGQPDPGNNGNGKGWGKGGKNPVPISDGLPFTTTLN